MTWACADLRHACTFSSPSKNASAFSKLMSCCGAARALGMQFAMRVSRIHSNIAGARAIDAEHWIERSMRHHNSYTEDLV